MKTLFATLACALAGLLPGTALADGTIFGVADDAGKFADDGGASFFADMKDIGLTENRMTVLWDPDNPTVIIEKGFLDRSIPVAVKNGINVVFNVYPSRTRRLGDPIAQAQFVSFLGVLAKTYPQVKDYIVGNEPNQTRFEFVPQFTNCVLKAAAVYEQVLANAYDTLKASDPSINVIGVGLSPRGNDNCNAPSNISSSPVRFIYSLGLAYRDSGRTAPIMDKLGFHPYPNSNLDPLEKGYQWPSAGFVNLDRIKQAIWDAFHDTGQPTFEESPAGKTAAANPPFLKFKLDEVGWQVKILESLAAKYHGRESVEVTEEDKQAAIYAEIVRRALCDSAIQEVLFFGLVDEADLDRFQAALERVDRSRRPAYDAVKQAIAGLRGRCGGAATLWKHATSVIGAAPLFKDLRPKPARQQYWAFNATATEDANYKAGVFKLTSKRLSPSDSSAISRVLASAKAGPAQVLSTSGLIKAYFSPLVKFNAQTLKPGFYVYAIRMSAAMNPGRTSFFVSKPFRVGK